MANNSSFPMFGTSSLKKGQIPFLVKKNMVNNKSFAMFGTWPLKKDRLHSWYGKRACHKPKMFDSKSF